MRLIYILPHPEFLLKKHSGSISHAKGVIEAFSSSGWDVQLICGGASELHLNSTQMQRANILKPASDQVSRSDYLGFIITQVELLLDQDTEAPTAIVLRHSTRVSRKLVTKLKFVAPRTPLVLEVNSFFCHRHRLPKPAIELLRFWESLPLRRANLIYSVSVALTEHIQRMPLSRPPFTTSMNGGEAYSGQRLRDMGEKPHFVYLGNMNRYDGVSRALSQYAQVAGRSAQPFKVIGSGKTLTQLRDMHSNTPSIRFYGHIPLDRALEEGIINTASVGFVSYSPPNIPIGSPTKLLDLLRSGVPVITPDIAQPAHIVSRFRVGTTYPKNDTTWLKERGLQMLNQDVIDEYRRNIEATYSEHLTWRKTLAPLVGEAERLALETYAG